MKVLFALGLAVVGLALAVPAVSQSPADAAAAWGLFGTWAVDCTRPASRQNGHLTFVRTNAGVVQLRDFGDLKDKHPVRAARVLPDGGLEIVMDLKGFSTVRTIVFAKESDGKKRAVSNRDEKGSYTIENGKFIANGADTPWQYRCTIPTQ